MPARDHRRRRRWLVAGGAAALTLATGVAVLAAGVFPDRIDLQRAEVLDTDLPTGPIAERLVRFEFDLLAPPDCQGGTGVEYGILVDADMDAATGTAVAGLDDVGAEALVKATCDVGTGEVTSEAGEVTVTTADGLTTVSIAVELGNLPSTEFLWVAYVQDFSDGTTGRLPEAGPAHFQTQEVELW